MIHNSDVKIKQKADGQHLMLEGRFKPATAMLLLHHMRSSQTHSQPVHIHTENVTSFETLGLSFFRSNLGRLRNEHPNFVFSGRNATWLLDAWPENDRPDGEDNGQDAKGDFYF